MKRLTYFSLRSFIGPFIVTFVISMFILIMQFFWLYIDDLMGKGIEIIVILELLFYVSAGLIPLALPLSILLSSIMTFGNLAEHNELTALKSSGLSLYRIIRPLAITAVGIALFTFYFANYVIPVANFKWHSIIYDIQQTKVSALLKPGSFSKELDGYAIKIDKGTEDTFEGILIHDHSSPKILKTVRAEKGKLYKSDNGKYLFFELQNGKVIEELNPTTPSYTPEGTQYGESNTRPSRRSKFKKGTYKIDISGFGFNKSDENMFKDKHEMLNVFQINTATDSLQDEAFRVQKNFINGLTSQHPYFISTKFKENTLPKLTDEGQEEVIPTNDLIVFDSLSSHEKRRAINNAQGKIRNSKENISNQEQYLRTVQGNMNSYLLEFHRKIALTVAIIILFFIGAPLGAIIKKGGFGLPVVVAALLFMVYFVLMTIGENLAQENTISPWLGMWFPSIVLGPIAVWFMIAAANDAPLLRLDRLRNWLSKKRLPSKKANESTPRNV